MFALAAIFTFAGLDLSSRDPASAHHWLYRTPLTRLGDFVLGMSLALLIQRFPPRPAVAGTAWALGGIPLVAVMVWPGMILIAWSWDAAYMIPTGSTTNPSHQHTRVPEREPTFREQIPNEARTPLREHIR